MSDPVSQSTAHVASLSALLMALFGWLPPFVAFVASVIALVYYSIQVYETATWQRILKWWAGVRGKVPLKPPDHDHPGPGILD